MKSLVLTAGSGSRLYPLTRLLPKALLDVRRKPVLDHIVSNLDSSNYIKEINVMYSNAFEYQFHEFEKYFKYRKKIELISDKHRIVNEMPGSVGAIAYVVKHKGINDDLLVVGGDNLFDFDIDEFINFYYLIGKKTSIAVYDVGDKNKVANKFGSVVVDEKSKVVRFEEKPSNPESSLISTLCYILSKNDLHHLNNAEILKENAGELIKHLVNNGGVYAYEFKGKFFDIGSYEDLEKARREF